MFFTDQPMLDAIVRGFVLSMFALAAVIVMVRVNGLRSLSKMSPFDFVMTVALGSLVAGGAQSSEWSQFWQVLTAMLGLFVLQYSAARLRKMSKTAREGMQNDPVLLMREGEYCREAMKRERVTEADVVAKLREANVLDFSEVRAVVLETTGDVSVLHGDKLEQSLLAGVDCR